MVQLFNLFPQICDGKIDEIEEEWRTVIIHRDLNNLSKDLENFWGNIFNLTNSMDEALFPHLKIFIGALLSLPHSSSAAERIFSDLNNIKTSNRNCLKTKTINALLTVKQLTKNKSLFEWKPSKQILNNYKLA